MSFLYDYVDYIWCINYINTYKDLRKNLESQFNYLNIDYSNANLFSYINDFDNLPIDKTFNFYKNEYNNYVNNNNLLNRNIESEEYNHKFFKLGYNLYKICKLSLFNKYKRILIFEDDIYSYNNLNVIKEYLNHIPNNYDIISLAPHFFDNQFNYLIYSINDYYIEHNIMYPFIYSGSAVIINEHTMKTYVKLVEEHNLLFPLDVYYLYYINNCNICYSNKSLFSQKQHLDYTGHNEGFRINLFKDNLEYRKYFYNYETN